MTFYIKYCKFFKKTLNVKHENQLKHFLNRNVLSFVLNVVTLSAFLIYSGVVFHN